MRLARGRARTEGRSVLVQGRSAAYETSKGGGDGTRLFKHGLDLTFDLQRNKRGSMGVNRVLGLLPSPLSLV